MTAIIRRAAHPTAGRAGASPRLAAAVAVAFAFTLACAAPGSLGADAPAAGLDAGVRASWTRLPVRQWADRAGTIAGMPVIVDRRIDPGLAITLDCRGEPLGAVLDRVAALANARAEPLASTIRIVPVPRAGWAAASEAAREGVIAKLPTASRRALRARAAWTWPDAARPRDLVADAAAAGGVVVSGLDAIPHDHFPAASLPPLSLAERLDLVLAHFDLRVEWTAGGGAIVPLVAPASDAPAAAVSPRGPRPAERPRRDGKKTVTVRDVYSLRVEAPLDQALDAIAPRLGVAAVELDRESLAARGVAPGEIVRIDVHEVSRDELLDAIVKPLGLAWSITGDRLRVTAGPSDAASGEKP
jgi:hypothetical protein